VLAEKGHVTHRRDGHRYVFRPVISRERAQKKATRRLVKTFFDGSPEKAVAALLEETDRLEPVELDRIEALIAKAREEGR
jgi:predicted transcriptional regulator